jgi:hypothetical protein
MIYLANEINTIGTISKLTFYVEHYEENGGSDDGDEPGDPDRRTSRIIPDNEPIEIWMGETSLSSFTTSWVPYANFTSVWTGSWEFTDDYDDFVPFEI